MPAAPPRDVVLLTLARALGELGLGAALGVALAGDAAAAAACVLFAVVGLGLGARLAAKKGRRARLAGQLLALAALGGTATHRATLAGLGVCAVAAGAASVLLLRERADRSGERPRLTPTIVALGGAATVTHAAPLGPARAAVALAILTYAGALAAMSAALTTGPGRPPPRALDVAIFLGLGAAAVATLTVL